MTVELYIDKEFEHNYENEALKIVENSMVERFGRKNNLYIILANYSLKGKPIDMTIMKNDGIFIIELKCCERPFTACENGDWITDEGKPIGHQGMNPYQQVNSYRGPWFDLLRDNKEHFACLKNHDNEQRIKNVKGIVAFYPFIHKNFTNKIPKEKKSPKERQENWWFFIDGINKIAEIIENETYPGVNFSDDELRLIAESLLNLNKTVNFYEKKDRIGKQIRQVADGIIKLIEINGEKVINLEKEHKKLQAVVNEKEIFFLEIQGENKQLCKIIEEQKNIIFRLEQERNQLSNDFNEKIEKIQSEAAKSSEEKFYHVAEYVISNYLEYIDHKKAVELARLSKKFGVEESYARKIMQKIASAQKKKS